ncbi:unnamed protein product [Peronospora destructor]|uniref:Uncharacterized protein n=1 Tax=Peronospora destructor TaxID=86335 RepID=A0AAV0TR59_9STRA|nr:unnamed protein product [Peronospora destructor]
MLTGGKKRPRADLLSSLDAAFSSTAQSAASKYTVQDAEEALLKENKQQAYQQSKRKRKYKKCKDKEGNGRRNGKGANEQAGNENKKKTKMIDPLYEKMNVELLALGLKNCSLESQVQALTNPRTLHQTLKNYLEFVTKGTRAGSNVAGSLKNKVLCLDNPFKTTVTEATGKMIASASRKQTAKLMGARRRRELGLHLLRGAMKYSDAMQLNDIWTRYVSQVIESELCEVHHVAEEPQRTRNAKLHSKLKYIDLSGCPLEVIQSRNPCNVGRSGIVVAETQQTLQICCLTSLGDDGSNGIIRTFVKWDSCFKVRMSSARNLFLDGAWFAERAQ